MTIEVRKISKYQKIILRSDDTTIEIGLLDAKEAIEYAGTFEDAALALKENAEEAQDE